MGGVCQEALPERENVGERGKKRGKQPRQRTARAKALRQKGRVCWKGSEWRGA